MGGAGGGGAGGAGGASGAPHANRGVTANNIARAAKHSLINVFIFASLFFDSMELEEVYFTLLTPSI